MLFAEKQVSDRGMPFVVASAGRVGARRHAAIILIVPTEAISSFGILFAAAEVSAADGGN